MPNNGYGLALSLNVRKSLVSYQARHSTIQYSPNQSIHLINEFRHTLLINVLASVKLRAHIIYLYLAHPVWWGLVHSKLL
jgi:hypothetical protein